MSLYTAVCEVKLRVKNLMSDFSSSERTFYRYLLSLGAETEENHESDGDNIRDVFSIDVLSTTSPN